MKNQDYVQTLTSDPQRQQEIVQAMEKYGDNHWWEPDADRREFAYYQIHEPVLFVKRFDELRASLDVLLGRSVRRSELATILSTW